MKIFKKGFAVLAIYAVILGAASGCSRQSGGGIILQESAGDSDKNNIARLSFFGFKADSVNLVAVESALHGFMDINPCINIVYESIKGLRYWSALEKRNKSGMLDDVFMVNHDVVIEMAGDGKLADLSGLSTIGNYQNAMREQFVNEDGSVYFLPTAISFYGLYINYDLLAANGFEVPENWAEFSEICNYFVSQGVTPVIANNYSALKMLMIGKSLYNVYQKNASEAIKAFNKDPASFAEAMVPGIKMVREMIDKGWMDSGEVLRTQQTSDDLKLFAAGDRPFMVTGGWASFRVMSMKPGLSFGVHPFPILEDGSVLVMSADTCISVNAESKHLEKTLRFVEYITQTDVIWDYCNSQNSYTPLNDDRIPSDSTIIPSVEYLTNGRNVIGSDYRFTMPVDSSLYEVGLLLLNGMGEEDALVLLTKLLAQ